MCGAPTGDSAWGGQRGWPNAAKRHFAQTLVREKPWVCAGCGSSAAIQVTHFAGVGVMDEPKRVATHACHMRVNHAQNRSSGNGRVNR
jgi:hypothetical protein